MAEFKFSCPQCRQHIQCDTSYAGMQIDCPVCQKPIAVPQPPLAVSAVPPPVAVRSCAMRNVLLIAAAVLVLVGLVFVGWFGFSKIMIYNIHGHFPPGLVALWSGDGNGGDSAGGNKMDLTDITFVKGKVGQAFSFNGTSSSIRIPASRALDLDADNGFTIMAWIKPSDINGLHPLFQWSDTDSNPLNIWIGVRPFENGVLMASTTVATGNRFLVSNPGVLVKGRFQHIALTFDKASGNAIWYLNGVVVAQRQLGGHLSATRGDLVISHRDENPGNWSTGRTYSGLMDEIAIYNRALSASEVQAVCTQQNHGEPLPLPASSTGWYESWMK